MRKIFSIYLLFNLSFFYGQDLNCEITIDARQTGQENLQIFKSLENQLNEFINNNSWTGRSVRPNEKINCAMFLNISSMDNDSFNGTLQIQASRPVYNSSYSSPVYNFNDKNFNFRYQEYQNLNFNPNQFENNLISIIEKPYNYAKSKIDFGLDDLEISNETMDFCFSLGVLHHVPDTQKALKKCASLLKPGAPFLGYLYYNFENKSQLFRFIWRFSDFFRICSFFQSFQNFPEI